MKTLKHQIKLLQEQLASSESARAGILLEYDKVCKRLADAEAEIKLLRSKKRPQLKQKCDSYTQMDLWNYENSPQ